jgi:hypothetical protein
VERDDADLARDEPSSGSGSGVVPARFFAERFAGELTLAADADSLAGRVVEIAHVDAIETLRTRLASFAVALRIEAISLATIVGELPKAIAANPRALTQRISREVYEQSEHFAGIAAPSSLGSPYTNYTIFENPDAQGTDRLRVAVWERTRDDLTGTIPTFGMSSSALAYRSKRRPRGRPQRKYRPDNGANVGDRPRARHGEDDFLFTSTDGNPIQKSNFIRRDWHPLLGKAGLPQTKFHTLRHTAATLMLS